MDEFSWEKQFGKEIKDLKVSINSIREHIVELKVDIATLKVKSGLWGLMGGLIPVLILAAVTFLNSH